jgi:hypothetical protein
MKAEEIYQLQTPDAKSADAILADLARTANNAKVVEQKHQDESEQFTAIFETDTGLQLHAHGPTPELALTRASLLAEQIRWRIFDAGRFQLGKASEFFGTDDDAIEFLLGQGKTHGEAIAIIVDPKFTKWTADAEAWIRRL